MNKIYSSNKTSLYIIAFFGILFLTSFCLYWFLQSNEDTGSVQYLLILISGIAFALTMQSLQELSHTLNNSEIIEKLNDFRDIKKQANEHNSKAMGKFRNVRSSLIKYHEVNSDGVLPNSSTVLGIASLENFARKYEPDCIIGVNRGGWLLSVYLAHRLNIDRSNIFRFDAERKDMIDKDEFINHFQESHSNRKPNILLVDDISRTGKSMQEAIDCVKSKFYFESFSVIVLVVCGEKTHSCIDYNPYWTQYKDIQLPWSSDKRKKEARKNIDAQVIGKVVRLGDGNSLEQKSPNQILRIADEHTKDGEEFDIANEDMDIFSHLAS
jgi:hypoxanthine phosphoribosyltransferase